MNWERTAAAPLMKRLESVVKVIFSPSPNEAVIEFYVDRAKLSQRLLT